MFCNFCHNRNIRNKCSQVKPWGASDQEEGARDFKARRAMKPLWKLINPKKVAAAISNAIKLAYNFF
jgi:hypothetical protein